MKKNAFRYTGVIIVTLVVLAVLAAFFYVLYEPELSLRTLLKQPVQDQAEVERLLELSKVGRFDLTDSIQLAKLLEDAGRVEDTLEVFRQLKERFSDSPVIGLWYADRLQKYERWELAEISFLELLELLHKTNDTPTRPRLWSAREKELAVAQRSGSLPDTIAGLQRSDIFRKLAENAMSAGAESEGIARVEWFRKSEAYFLSCLEITPSNYVVRGAFANLLLQMNRPEESLQNYQELLKDKEDNLGWLISASLAAAAAKQFHLAERYIREALRVENRDEWRLEMSRIMSWGGKHDAALNEINALIEEHPEEKIYLLERAEFLLNAGRHRDYLTETAALAARNPLNLELRINRIRAMVGLRLYREAVNEATAILAIEPTNVDAAIMKAEALLWSGEYKAAQADLLILVNRLPTERLLAKQLAQSFLWDKNYAAALDVFRKLSPADLTDLDLSQGYAEAVAGQKNISREDLKTIHAMGRIISVKPEVNWPAPMLAAMGRALREAGEHDLAVELLDQAAERASSNLRLRLELADLLQSVGRYEEAEKQYRIITDHEKKGAK